MSEFTNVSVIKKANIYFGGKVTSRTVIFPNGVKKTLGVMLPGDYTFNTGAKELMEIQSGLLELQLAGETSWRTIKGGESFDVPANSSFSMQVKEVSDYICSFLP
ncbi:MAG: pyrimidine/purine nucleoside phosphorylase [Desulfobulbaceae bacterium]|nr:pyrimidine/purine nucleoside phosphorylase [Desulfobulbaceae bacterium]